MALWRYAQGEENAWWTVS